MKTLGARRWRRFAELALGAALSVFSGSCAVHKQTTKNVHWTSVFTDVSFPGSRSRYLVAIEGNRISEVIANPSTAAADACSAGCRKIVGDGMYLVPGFHDAHAHVLMAGEQFGGIRVDEETLHTKIREYARSAPEHRWIVAHWAPRRVATNLPAREELDQILPSRPLVIFDTSGHAVAANSRALEQIRSAEQAETPRAAIAGARSSVPEGFERAIAEGRFVEQHADEFRKLMPRQSEAEQRADVQRFQELSIAVGCTSTQGGPVTLEEFELFVRMAQDGTLKQRSFVWLPLEMPEAGLERALALARRLPPDGMLQVVAMKGFVDGVFLNHTAALLEPYSDRPETSGELRLAPEVLHRLIVRANRAGLPVALHAVGDRAVEVALDAFESAAREVKPTLPNRIEHAHLVAPRDLPRFAQLGVVASIQPVQLLNLQFVDHYIGERRASALHPWRALLDAGTTLVFGSDSPTVGPPDPLRAMFFAVEREIGGVPVNPTERLTPQAALSASTTAPAEIIGWGDRLGKIAPNYLADLVLLPRDPLSFIVPRAAQNPPALVMVNGRIVLDHTLAGLHSR